MSKGSVLVVDDEELIRWSLSKDLANQGYDVSTAATAAEALRLHDVAPADVVLLDICLPDGDGVQAISGFHRIREDTVVIMITSTTALETAVEAMRQGAHDYVTKPFDFPKLWNAIAKGVERVGLREENRALRSREKVARPPEVVCESPAMKHVLDLAHVVAETEPATVLLRGESGVGKDLIAMVIHRKSPRAARLFLDINCASLPDALLESELFGHERGAFTDAKTQKRGLFELATGGTVYLDEVADASLAVQAKLLKVLEQRSFRRVGGTRDITTDVRVIAATNRDVEEAVARKVMRQDLYYRLNVFPIVIPPLRERREDILPLARHFLLSYGASFRKKVPGFSAGAETRLQAHAWPGNIRELRNVIERAMILAHDGEAIGADLFPPGMGVTEQEPHAPDGEPSGMLAETEAHMIREALSATGGNQTRAAARLGVSRDALRRRMRRFGIAIDGDEK